MAGPRRRARDNRGRYIRRGPGARTRSGLSRTLATIGKAVVIGELAARAVPVLRAAWAAVVEVHRRLRANGWPRLPPSAPPSSPLP